MMAEPDKNIAKKQNETTSLEKLSAQNYLYSIAKNFKGLQIFLSVILIIIISFTKSIFEKTGSDTVLGLEWTLLAPYFSLASVLITITNTYLLKPIIGNKVKCASLIQYEFDTIVMSINQNILYKENGISYESIRNYSVKNIKRGYPPGYFKDWYSSKTDSIDKAIGNYICIRTNLVWDKKLRTTYRNSITIFLIIFSLALLIPSFIYGVTIRSFTLEILIPLMPLYTFSISEIIDNHNIILKKDKINSVVEMVWNRILSNNISQEELSQISKECLEQLILLRRENPLIFDWFYKLTQKSSNDEMDYSADKLIDDYISRI